MYGYIEWTEHVRKPKVTEREIFGVRFRCIQIPRRGTPGFLQRRTFLRGARQLQREGVTRAVFPEVFPWKALFEQQNIRPADPTPLYRAMAAELVQHRLAGRGGKDNSVAVCAPRLNDDVRRLVTELCIRNRYVMLAVPERSDEFCRKLRREYGVSLVQTSDISGAAAAVRFSPDMESCGENIDLFPEAEPPREELRLSDEVEAQLPAECNRQQLLAALYGAGAVRWQEIRIFDPSTAKMIGSQGEKP